MAGTTVADMKVRLLTVGHGTAGQDEFAELLASAGVQALVDVRIAPGATSFRTSARTSSQSGCPPLA